MTTTEIKPMLTPKQAAELLGLEGTENLPSNLRVLRSSRSERALSDAPVSPPGAAVARGGAGFLPGRCVDGAMVVAAYDALRTASGRAPAGVRRG